MKTIMFFLILPLALAFVIIIPILWIWYAIKDIINGYGQVKKGVVVDMDEPVETNKIPWGEMRH